MNCLFKYRPFVCRASVAGHSHIKKGIANQDSFLCVRKRKYLLIVVSDGMGSKPYADVGSKKACKAVKTEIARFVKNKNNPLSVSQLFANIVETWKKLLQQRDAHDCSATCLFVFATKSKIMTARLGDGMICLLGKSGAESIALTDSKDETFSNVTQSLSDVIAADEFKYDFYDKSLFKGIVLSTDGISSDLESGMELPFAEDIFCNLKRMHFWRRNAFIRNMMRNWSVPHHTDDKTLIVAGF